MYIVSTINSATSIVDFKKQRTQKIEIYSKPYKYTIFSTNTQTHIFSFHLQISKLPPTHRTHTHIHWKQSDMFREIHILKS